jgi:uncharacterized protein YqhQ
MFVFMILPMKLDYIYDFGAPKLFAFPICKCYAFLNILLGYPLCLTTTHKIKYIINFGGIEHP